MLSSAFGLGWMPFCLALATGAVLSSAPSWLRWARRSLTGGGVNLRMRTQRWME